MSRVNYGHLKVGRYLKVDVIITGLPVLCLGYFTLLGSWSFPPKSHRDRSHHLNSQYRMEGAIVPIVWVRLHTCIMDLDKMDSIRLDGTRYETVASLELLYIEVNILDHHSLRLA